MKELVPGTVITCTLIPDCECDSPIIDIYRINGRVVKGRIVDLTGNEIMFYKNARYIVTIVE